METLLILYPIQPYAEVLMFRQDHSGTKYAEIYQRLIANRYQNTRLIWMMFSEKESPRNPDLSQLWRGISVGENDVIGACGVSFEEHCGQKKYPDPKTVIEACPKPIEKLVIGGFHFWDCVEKAAQYAHGQGIDVLVDDDLTEFFFYKVRDREGMPSSDCIPVSRKESILKDRKNFLRSGGRDTLMRVRAARKGKPWLAHI